MSIEFIRDEFLEGKKEELVNIDKELSKKKPKKVDRKVIFLRRFTLALMGQYKVKPHVKDKEIEMLNREIIDHTRVIHNFKRPIQRLMPPTPNNLQVPRPGMQVPMPLREELVVPTPMAVNNIPKEKVKIKDKKEFSIPKPV